ncbi:MAG: carboxypeptidase-like regulatory domain-containing protein [Candidatus Wallbacteria bacterium]|nr:carboxypeptidase-like regulatory domain-containing protein [Candidatus Wallbacteria bacterium]
MRKKIYSFRFGTKKSAVSLPIALIILFLYFSVSAVSAKARLIRLNAAPADKTLQSAPSIQPHPTVQPNQQPRIAKTIAPLMQSKSLVPAISNEIELYSGWNLISLGLQPTSGSIEVIFAAISSSMHYVMGFLRDTGTGENEGFRTYMNLPGIKEFSNLLTMDGYHGYWVYMISDATLEVSGTRIYESREQTMKSGWNLVGSWINADSSLPTALDSSETVIDTIFNQHPISGKVRYIMGFYRNPSDKGPEGFRTFMNNSAINFSTLSSMLPAYGYWFYMEGDGILRYGNRILSGTVTDDQTGLPVSGAGIFLLNTTYATETDSSGYYEFSDIPAGTYTVIVKCDGIVTKTIPDVNVQ